MRRADERDHVLGRSRDLAERPLRRLEEARPQQEILRWVARDGKLGEEDELGACCARLVEAGQDPVAVAVEVADDRVDLGEGESHGFSLSVENRLEHRAEPGLAA